MTTVDGVTRMMRAHLRSENWMEEALCSQVDPDLFFPEKGAASDAARACRICESCPVQKQCLQFAVRTGTRWGVWGGVTERNLQRMIHRHRVASS